jgi:ribonuclease R
MSVVMELNSQGRVLHHEVFRSVIHSAHRLTYRQAQDLFDGAAPSETSEFADAHEMLFRMRELAQILAAKRQRQGSLDMDIPETEVLLDEESRVLDVRRSERWESHRLIEQFMILANETVAQHLEERELPLIYRIHEPPDPDQLERLRPFLKAIGVNLPARQKEVSQKTLQRILDRLDRLETGSMFHILVLRVMMRAIYSTKNLGHYGLASPCYCHFTSPIRRYPDLVVHRVLGATFDRDEIPKRTREEWNERFAETARHATSREERADEIERDTVKVKSLEFMRKFVGEEYEGIISGVTSFGFFVELVPYPVEGLVHMRVLRDDYYQYEEESLSLVGESSGRRYRFGDKLRVVLTRVDLINLQMDFVPVELADEIGAPHRRRKPGRRGGPKRRRRKT